MRLYNLTSLAQLDLQEIWLYIAQDNPSAADRVESALYNAFAKLAENPYLGSTRNDLTTKPVRFWPVTNYHIIYDPLLVIRILNGYRDIGTHLNEKAL